MNTCASAFPVMKNEASVLVADHRRSCGSLALQSLAPNHPMHRGRGDPAQHGQAVGSPPGLPAHGRDRRLLHE